jgi:CO dehydrogenase/acetyl-CoA synthase delta subunit
MKMRKSNFDKGENHEKVMMMMIVSALGGGIEATFDGMVRSSLKGNS